MLLHVVRPACCTIGRHLQPSAHSNGYWAVKYSRHRGAVCRMGSSLGIIQCKGWDIVGALWCRELTCDLA